MFLLRSLSQCPATAPCLIVHNCRPIKSKFLHDSPAVSVLIHAHLYFASEILKSFFSFRPATLYGSSTSPPDHARPFCPSPPLPSFLHLILQYPSGLHPAICSLDAPLISFPLDSTQKSSLPFYTPPSYVNGTAISNFELLSISLS